MFDRRCASEVLWFVILVEVGHEDLCGSKHARVINALETMELAENDHVGIRAFPLQMVVESIAPDVVYLEFSKAFHIISTAFFCRN